MPTADSARRDWGEGCCRAQASIDGASECPDPVGRVLPGLTRTICGMSGRPERDGVGMSVLRELLDAWQTSIRRTEGPSNGVGTISSRDRVGMSDISAIRRSTVRTADTWGRSMGTGSSTAVPTALKSAVLSRRHEAPAQPLQTRPGPQCGETSHHFQIDSRPAAGDGCAFA